MNFRNCFLILPRLAFRGNVPKKLERLKESQFGDIGSLSLLVMLMLLWRASEDFLNERPLNFRMKQSSSILDCRLKASVPESSSHSDMDHKPSSLSVMEPAWLLVLLELDIRCLFKKEPGVGFSDILE